MGLRTAGLAGVAGLATFLVVGALVAELVAGAIEFSLFVGIPVGIVAGVAVAAFVYGRLEGVADPDRRRPAIALASFGVVFLVTLVIAVGPARLGAGVGLSAAAIVGLGAAVATDLWIRLSCEDAGPAGLG